MVWESRAISYSKQSELIKAAVSVTQLSDLITHVYLQKLKQETSGHLGGRNAQSLQIAQIFFFIFFFVVLRKNTIPLLAANLAITYHFPHICKQ